MDPFLAKDYVEPYLFGELFDSCGLHAIEICSHYSLLPTIFTSDFIQKQMIVHPEIIYLFVMSRNPESAGAQIYNYGLYHMIRHLVTAHCDQSFESIFQEWGMFKTVTLKAIVEDPSKYPISLDVFIEYLSRRCHIVFDMHPLQQYYKKEKKSVQGFISFSSLFLRDLIPIYNNYQQLEPFGRPISCYISLRDKSLETSFSRSIILRPLSFSKDLCRRALILLVCSVESIYYRNKNTYPQTIEKLLLLIASRTLANFKNLALSKETLYSLIENSSTTMFLWAILYRFFTKRETESSSILMSQSMTSFVKEYPVGTDFKRAVILAYLDILEKEISIGETVTKADNNKIIKRIEHKRRLILSVVKTMGRNFFLHKKG